MSSFRFAIMQIVVQMPLPVDAHVDAIVEHARRERFGVVVAPPGSGKTTRIPPALAAIGRTILLQPRRVAARALARRMAFERHWTIAVDDARVAHQIASDVEVAHALERTRSRALERSWYGAI